MKEEAMNNKGIVSRLKKNGKGWIIILAGVLGIILLLFGGASDKTDKNAKSEGEEDRFIEYSDKIEAKILELCSKVEGVNNVSVAVSFESGFEYVYATDGDKTLTVGSGSSENAVQVTQKPPTISGIGIVCTGGGNPQIQQRLINLISSAFGIGSNRIYITEAQK